MVVFGRFLLQQEQKGRCTLQDGHECAHEMQLLLADVLAFHTSCSLLCALVWMADFWTLHTSKRLPWPCLPPRDTVWTWIMITQRYKEPRTQSELSMVSMDHFSTAQQCISTQVLWCMCTACNWSLYTMRCLTWDLKDWIAIMLCIQGQTAAGELGLRIFSVSWGQSSLQWQKPPCSGSFEKH